MRVLAVIALIVALACASAFAVAPIRPPTKALCNTDDYNWEDFSSYYKTNSSTTTQMCMFDAYEKACPTLTGLVACDKTVARCVDWVGTDTYKNLAGASNWGSAETPRECIMYGGNFFRPDQAILEVVQPLFADLIFLGVAIAAFICFKATNILVRVLVALLAIIGFVQSVSYYYLNCYVMLAAAFIALTCYSVKSNATVGVGMMVALVGFFWVTYGRGLGYAQHHSRVNAGPAIQDTYEALCNSYYSGYFGWAFVQMKDSHNVQDQYWGFCSRGAVAGQLFVQYFQECILMLIAVCGVFSLGGSDDKKEEHPEESAPVNNEDN